MLRRVIIRRRRCRAVRRDIDAMLAYAAPRYQRVAMRRYCCRSYRAPAAAYGVYVSPIRYRCRFATYCRQPLYASCHFPSP